MFVELRKGLSSTNTRPDHIYWVLLHHRRTTTRRRKWVLFVV